MFGKNTPLNASVKYLNEEIILKGPNVTKLPKTKIIPWLIVGLVIFSLMLPYSFSQTSQNAILSVNPTTATPQSWITATLSNYPANPNGDTYTPEIWLILQRASQPTITGESTMLSPRLDSTGWTLIPWAQIAPSTWIREFQLPDRTLSQDYGFFGPDKIVAEQDLAGTLQFVATTSFSMTPASTIEPTLTTQIATSKNLPIIIIPGVGGSELDAWAAGTSREVWPAPGGTRISQVIVNAWDLVSKADMSILRMNADGTGPEDPSVYVFASDLLRTGLSNFYGGLVQFFESKGYIEGQSLFVFPYDFRQDNSLHLAQLDQLIDQARIANSSEKVILVAHSMGGLIATAYVNSNSNYAEKVDSIITIGTPFWGSPKCYYAITQGYALGNAFVDPKQMKSMAINWPACYELLPRQPFIVTQNGGYLTLGQAFSIAYNAPYTEERWTFNSAILNKAYSFNSLIGTPENPYIPSNVKLYTIIGYGTQSLNGYEMRAPTNDEITSHMTVNIDGNEVVLVPQFSDGDGTVQLWGAENNAATAQYYVKTDPSYLGESAMHAKLPNNSKVQNVIWNIIRGNPPSTSAYTYSPINTGLVSGERIDLTVHSYANLEVITPDGHAMMGWNHYNGTIFEELPRGIFLEESGIQYASIQNSETPYIVFINGTDTGSFTLTTTVVNAGTTTTFSYNNIPTVLGTVAKLTLNPPEIKTTLPHLVVTTNQQTTSYNPELLSQDNSGNTGDSLRLLKETMFWGFIAVLIIIGALCVIVILRKSRKVHLPPPPPLLSSP